MMMKRGPMLKHIQTQRVAGREYRYLRVPGQKPVRLPDLSPDDPAFLRAYLAALGDTEASSAPASGTIAGLVAAFFASKALVGAQQFLPGQHTGPVQEHRLVERDLQ